MRKLKLFMAACALFAGGMSVNAQSWTSGSEVGEGEFYLYNIGADRYLTNGTSWVTHSIVDGQGTVLTLSLQDGKYRLNSGVSGGKGPYVWTEWMNDNDGSDGWVFTPVEYAGYTNAYKLQQSSTEGNYLYWSGGGSGAWGNEVYGSATSVDDTKAQNYYWLLIPKATRQTLVNATIEKPLDITYLIDDPDFEKRVSNSNNNSPKSGSGQNSTFWNNGGFWRQYSAQSFANAIFFEKYNGGGLTTADAIKQTKTLGIGTYRLDVTGYASCTEAYLYAGEDETKISEAGKYSVYFYVGEEKSVELGVKIKEGGTGSWVAFDNVRLFYYGNVTLAEVLLADKIKAYNEALAEAQSYEGKIFDEDWNVLKGVITNNSIDLSGSVTEEQLANATNNLTAANTVAAKAKVKYDTYNNVAAAIEGKTNVDVTSNISNLGFEDGNLNAWTSDDGGNVASNSNWGDKVDTYFVERWRDKSGNAGLSNGSLTHDVFVLPAGVYTIAANAQNIEQYNNNAAGTGYFLYANDEKVEIGASGTYDTYLKVADKDEVTIKFVLNECTGNWISCDNITVTYVGADFPAVTLVDAPMNATVKAAQTQAKSTYDADQTVTNYNALVHAIEAAQASANAYGHLTLAITKIQAAATSASNNGATITTEQQTALTTLYGKYTTGAIADADVLTEVANGYNMVAPIIKTQTAASADFTLAILNQSFEYGDMTSWTATASDDTGVRELSNPTYATQNADGYFIFNTWWQGVPLTQEVADLPNGQYTLKAVVASDDGAKIYLLANGEHNDGTITTDKTIGVEAEMTFLVKDGKVTIGAIGSADDEDKSFVEGGHWWYKADNFRLVKNRNLTAEEEAVAPTAIALYNGENQVTDPIALTATANTVTLTPSYTPGNASEGYIEWSTSNPTVATVADGVVTAVSTGTATITVTSTLDATVSATATVNVSFPESDYATYKNEGAKRTVYSLESNLIKNGSFDYPDNFYGWTNGAGSKMGTNGFDIVEEDGENVLRAKNGNNSDNGGGSVKAIGTAWPIENGKTYVFGYKVKSSGTAEYHVVSMTNTPGTETATLLTTDERKAINYNGSWTDQSYKFTNTENYAYIQFKARWLSNSVYFDDFYLCEVTGDDVEEGNVDYATAAIPTANIGTGAFQYSQDAIYAANTLEQGVATVAEVEAAYEALTTLNQPSADQAYNLVFNCDGHNYTGNALTLVPNPAQTQGGYGLQYKAPANVNLAQAFYFTHTTGNKYKVYAIDTDGNERYITTQAEGYGTTWYEGIRTIDDATKAMEIEIRPNGEGLYLLWNIGANKPLAHNGNNNNDLFTNNTANFQFVETTKPSIIINTTAAGWGTTILPFAQELPQGVKAYTCAGHNDDLLTLVPVDALEANKPYIIEGSWNATLTGNAQGTALIYTKDYLTGVYSATSAPVGSYVLQKNKKNNDKVGFYKVDEGEGKQPTVGANRCYLTVPSSARAFFLFDNETGISAIEALTSGEAQIFDINGVQQPGLQKGMNIIRKADGQSYKVMVK